ncbi:hypothetical protein CE91St56_09280 [Lachnospiraceae bacterium]|nr:hypothetical protein CE91St56_09280 [Lachnospiraceae bacterium]GKH39868.1 hypothetical protein CE91St57_08420 [Lachnospiraceae bacterium]
MPKTYFYYKYIWTHYLQFILLNFSLILLLSVKITKKKRRYGILTTGRTIGERGTAGMFFENPVEITDGTKVKEFGNFGN